MKPILLWLRQVWCNLRHFHTYQWWLRGESCSRCGARAYGPDVLAGRRDRKRTRGEGT